ncbi:hypothetical protein IBB56_00710 [Listeria welshimeri]|uniref:hypothetical protein n=1 Tax=Listeria welshimeri TaxID=1643 RepID=UPI0016243212|nr:hypothetical protein [Listeria welshimeri]MBC1981231.1 hypothetical protein [Listeria welshimeri]MBF2472263.1 hypothetical protein [Listeria welshimeri]MBF2637511.1 hypothetical protein [Listeria welshimeri]
MVEKNLECDLKKKINKRWYLECLPLFSMFINIVLLLIILFYGLSVKINVPEKYPWLIPTILISTMSVSYLIGWVANLKWLIKDRKKYEQELTTTYYIKLLKLINITSIIYLIPLGIPIVIIVRWGTKRIVNDKIKPNTLAAFIDEQYLKKVASL